MTTILHCIFVSSIAKMASYDVLTSSMADAHQILARHGLMLTFFCKRNTPGDGNCFFHALADQLTDSEIRDTVSLWARDIPGDHLVIRQRVVAFAWNNEEVFNDAAILNYFQLAEQNDQRGRNSADIYRDYLRGMRKPGAWVEDEVIVRIAAIFFQKDIRVIKENLDYPWLGGPQAVDPPFVIVNMRDTHFQSVQRRQAQNATAQRQAPPKSPKTPKPVSPLAPSQPPQAKRARSPLDILKEPCRNCGKTFNSLKAHLAKKSECLAAYDKSELSVAKKVLFRDDISSPQSTDILDMPCRNCGGVFKALTKHLGKKPDCMAAYNLAELNEARKKKTLASKRDQYIQNRPDILASRKKQYIQSRPDILASKKKQYIQNRPDILASKKKHYIQNSPQKLAYEKEHYTENSPQKLAQVKEYYAQNRPKRLAYKKAHYRFQRGVTFTNSSEQNRFESFQKDIKDGWAFACVCCHRLFFRKGVREAAPNCVRKAALNSECASREAQLKELRDTMNKKKAGLIESSIDRYSALSTKGIAYQGILWLCHTCIKYLKLGQCPSKSSLNGLRAETIPEELSLNDLETCLIAKKILFMKLFRLPRSGWNAVVDKTVDVPILDDDIRKNLNSVQSLPRLPAKAGLVAVQLKRKLEYRNKVIESFIDPDKLVAAVKKLKESRHPSYKDIDIDQSFVTTVQSAAQAAEDMDMDSDNESDSAPSEQEDEVEFSTFMTEHCPETSVVLNQGKDVLHKKRRTRSKESFSIAPGEGKVPTSLMRDKTFDIDAFPPLHPSGQYGLHHPRSKQLKAKDYIMQRLENLNPKWRNNKPWVFSMLYYLERQQLEGQIKISYQRGKKVGGTLVNPENVFSVFDRIPGTQRYWQQKRYEVIARLEDLGDFHFFFTLSCADQRWTENFTSILAQKGLDITFEKAMPMSKGTLGFMPDKVLVDGTPLEEYLSNESLSNLVRDNVLTVTRNFDHRVDCFMKRIVMSNPKLNAQFFNYRVEFQMRGAAHVHGVLWLKMREVEKVFPGINNVYSKLRRGEVLSIDENRVAAIFIDSFITCSTNNEVQDIVEDVQYHRHSKSCRKHGDFCRFQYPKLPSDETIVAQPLDSSKYSSEKALKDEQKRLGEICSRVKEVLVEYDGLLSSGLVSMQELEEITLDDILEQAGVSKASYRQALAVSKSRGTYVVLKRRPCEMNINNYNPEWIKAWNGNMDLQVCLDPFAVCTYITDYYTKDESGATKFLMEAAKECRGMERSDQLKFITNTFLTHRQMGECEAYYRMLPHLHLSESNIGCVFQASGQPQDRSRIVYPVKQGDKLVEEDLEDGESPVQSNLIQIPGREGFYKEAPSKIDKYQTRPEYLDVMCLAQFVKCFDSISLKEGRKRQYTDGMSFSKSE